MKANEHDMMKMVRKRQKVSEEIKVKKKLKKIGIRNWLTVGGGFRSAWKNAVRVRGEEDEGEREWMHGLQGWIWCETQSGKEKWGGGDHKGTWDSSGGEKYEKLAARKTSKPASPTKLFHLLTLNLSPFNMKPLEKIKTEQWGVFAFCAALFVLPCPTLSSLDNILLISYFMHMYSFCFPSSFAILSFFYSCNCAIRSPLCTKCWDRQIFGNDNCC